NFIDRQIIAILSPAIKAEFEVSDTALGFLKGLAFAMLYSTLGIPIARLADRRNRVTIVASALAIWSGFTALSGLAANFVQLALARVAVGIGEAGCSPPSHSLISDYYPKEKRASALAIYALGIPFGIMFAFLLGGYLASEVGWRMTLILLGAPGVALAVVVKLTVREPPRGAHDQSARLEQPPLLDGLRTIWAAPSYRLLCTGAGLAAMSSFALATWVVDFYVRIHELSFVAITTPLAAVMGLGLGFGTYLGGFLGDRLGARDRAYYMLLPAVGFALATPFAFFALTAAGAGASFAWLAVVNILTGIYTGPTFATIQTLAPVRARALSAAVFLFIANLAGMGLGPLAAGAISDALTPSFGEAEGLRWSLVVMVFGYVLSAAFFYAASRRVSADLDAAAAAS
ncbi:MAG: MFS transporter, partial [Caulobacterales bacterium]|nr:MFS transporter [Caulobacterales bacterium]